MLENSYTLSYYETMKSIKMKGLPEIRKAGNLSYEEVRKIIVSLGKDIQRKEALKRRSSEYP